MITALLNLIKSQSKVLPNQSLNQSIKTPQNSTSSGVCVAPMLAWAGADKPGLGNVPMNNSVPKGEQGSDIVFMRAHLFGSEG